MLFRIRYLSAPKASSRSSRIPSHIASFVSIRPAGRLVDTRPFCKNAQDRGISMAVRPVKPSLGDSVAMFR
jgi:hypothetical protein